MQEQERRRRQCRERETMRTTKTHGGAGVWPVGAARARASLSNYDTRSGAMATETGKRDLFGTGARGPTAHAARRGKARAIAKRKNNSKLVSTYFRDIVKNCLSP